MLELRRLVRYHGRGESGDETGLARVRGEKVTRHLQGQRHFPRLDRVLELTRETITEPGVVLHQLLQRHHVGALVDEEVDALLLYLKVHSLPLPHHAQHVELELLAAVPDQERSILVSRLLLHQRQRSLPVNVGVIPLSGG